MRVLKNNCETNNFVRQIKTDPYPRKLICEYCGSELEYDEPDLHMGEYGCMHLDCPCCGEDNMLDKHEKNIILTKNNIEFPIHFHHVCVENGAVECCDKYFKKYIDDAINYLRQNKNEVHYGGHITGNFYISVRKYEGDEVYDVTVSRDFYTMDIPFEEADY